MIKSRERNRARIFRSLDSQPTVKIIKKTKKKESTEISIGYLGLEAAYRETKKNSSLILRDRGEIFVNRFSGLQEDGKEWEGTIPPHGLAHEDICRTFCDESSSPVAQERK